jgi:quercetin dioxygenase-like cupin family protein
MSAVEFASLTAERLRFEATKAAPAEEASETGVQRFPMSGTMPQMSSSLVFRLESFPIHLGLGATAVRQPSIEDKDFFEAYAARHTSDGAEGRLVSMFTFSQPWTVWERHPRGAELVVCTSGTITVHQEQADGTVQTATLHAGDAVVNPPGVWHTADVTAPATALFITAGIGTEHRPRESTW